MFGSRLRLNVEAVECWTMVAGLKRSGVFRVAAIHNIIFGLEGDEMRADSALPYKDGVECSGSDQCREESRQRYSWSLMMLDEFLHPPARALNCSIADCAGNVDRKLYFTFCRRFITT